MELRELLMLASPGPWGIEESVLGCKTIVDGRGNPIMWSEGLHNEAEDQANIDLICALRNTLERQYITESGG